MNIAAILAGGKGLRMGGSVPKQFLEVGGMPIIVHTINKFQNHSEIDEICVICPVEHCEYMWELVENYKLTKVKSVIPGGKDRQESSYVATEAMYFKHGPEGILLIHDGARPNVDDRIISENIEKASNTGACNTVIPSQDTILISKDGKISFATGKKFLSVNESKYSGIDCDSLKYEDSIRRRLFYFEDENHKSGYNL